MNVILESQPGDELILVDNSGTARDVDGVTLLVAAGERSPAHARNAGAAHAAIQFSDRSIPIFRRTILCSQLPAR